MLVAILCDQVYSTGQHHWGVQVAVAETGLHTTPPPLGVHVGSHLKTGLHTTPPLLGVHVGSHL
jgi:hypothetical protein